MLVRRTYTITLMSTDTLHSRSALPDKSNTAANRSLIREALEKSPHLTSELLGVFVFNAQSPLTDRSLYDTAIPIDFFDQMRLQSLRLVVGTNKYAPAERRIPTDILTDLGVYIVRNTVIVTSEDDNESLPEIDAEELLRLVS
mgnify:CR=1 FL=1